VITVRDTAMQLLVALVPGLLIAILASIITVRLSLRRFYSERWWERKAQAYTELIDGLYRIKLNAEKFLDHRESGRSIARERAEETARMSRQGREAIDRATAVGAFVISKEAVGHLAQFRAECQITDRQWQKDDDLDQLALGDMRAAEKCLNALRETAKRDLSVG
jgi:hypothetical protein